VYECCGLAEKREREPDREEERKRAREKEPEREREREKEREWVRFGRESSRGKVILYGHCC
jgi:hypothetical protein